MKMFSPEDFVTETEDPMQIDDLDAVDMALGSMGEPEMVENTDIPQDGDEASPYFGGSQGTYGVEGSDPMMGDMGDDMDYMDDEEEFPIYDETSITDPEEQEAQKMDLQAGQLEQHALSEGLQDQNMAAASQDRAQQRKLRGQ